MLLTILLCCYVVCYVDIVCCQLLKSSYISLHINMVRGVAEEGSGRSNTHDKRQVRDEMWFSYIPLMGPLFLSIALSFFLRHISALSSFLHFSASRCICLSILLSIYLSIYLFIYQSIYVSVYLIIFAICFSIVTSLPISLSSISLSLSLSLYLSISLSSHSPSFSFFLTYLLSYSSFRP